MPRAAATTAKQIEKLEPVVREGGKLALGFALSQAGKVRSSDQKAVLLERSEGKVLVQSTICLEVSPT